MAKGKVTVSVEANTTKATASIRELQKQAESLNLGKALKGLSGAGVPGLDKLQDVSSKLSSLGGIGGALAPLAAGGGVVAGLAAYKAALDDLVQAGSSTNAELQALSTTMATLDRNLGGSGRNMADVAKDIKLLAANGSNSVESLSSAMQQLTLAYDGNTTKARKTLAVFDDLAAGTGISADRWAQMAAKVRASGVEYKDLNQLAKRGLPIYQALGDVMGSTADAAKAAAKAGQLSAEQWQAAVERLAERYKGLSAELSSKTLEGAQATYDASKGLMAEGAAAGYAEVRTSGLNALSDRMQELANDPAWRESTAALGEFTAALDNATSEAGQWWDEQKTRTLGFLADVATGGGISERATERMQAATEEAYAGLERAFQEAMQGKLTLGQMEDLRGRILGADVGTNFERTGRNQEAWYDMERQLAGLIADMRRAQEQEAAAAKQQEAAAAKLEAQREAIAKYGNIDERLASLREQGYIGDNVTKDNLGATIANTIEALKAGSYADAKPIEGALKQLQDMQRELERTAEAERKLADERAKASAAAERQLEASKLSTRAGFIRELDAAQNDYKSLTERLNDLRADNALRLSEEEHGIYRDRWKDLQAAGYDRQEAKLLEAQTKAAKRVDDLTKKLGNFEQDWNKYAQRAEQFFIGCVAGNVVKVKGTAVAG